MKHSFLLSLVLIMGMLTLSLSACSTEKESNDLKVMSFNIRLSPNDSFDGLNSWVFRKGAALRLIEAESPDIFGVQEAIYRQGAFLQENLPNYTKYGVDREQGLEDGEAEASAIFFKKEKFTLLNKGTFWLSETPDKPSMGWDAACFRVVSWVHLKEHANSGREIFFLNTHFDHVGSTARRESGKLLVAKIKELVPPGVAVIVTGDFNATIDNDILTPLKNNLTYVRLSVAGSDAIKTYNAWGKSNEAALIDHIFCKNIVPTYYRTVTDNYGVPFVSDHYPIVAILK